MQEYHKFPLALGRVVARDNKLGNSFVNMAPGSGKARRKKKHGQGPYATIKTKNEELPVFNKLNEVDVLCGRGNGINMVRVVFSRLFVCFVFFCFMGLSIWCPGCTWPISLGVFAIIRSHPGLVSSASSVSDDSIFSRRLR